MNKQPQVVNTAALAAKIFKAKKVMGKVTKKSSNPFFGSKYADINNIIEVVQPALEEVGLLLIQPTFANAHGVNYVASRIFDVDTGEFVESTMALPADVTDPQKIGSAVTYYRRYTLQSLLGLAAEDDDANSVSSKVKSKPRAVKKASGDDF